MKLKELNILRNFYKSCSYPIKFKNDNRFVYEICPVTITIISISSFELLSRIKVNIISRDQAADILNIKSNLFIITSTTKIEAVIV